MRIAILSAGVVALLVLVPGTLLAATHHVSASGNNTPPYDTWETASHTIQAAIDVCADGDTVFVGAGRYNPGSGEMFPIRIGDLYTGLSVVIIGVRGAPETIVDAQETGEVFHLIDSGVNIHGLTVTGGSGDGIFVHYGQVSIAECWIADNGWGGVHADLSGTIRISKSNVTGNGDCGLFSETTVTVDSCEVSGNGGRLGYGCGIYASGARVTGSEITGNFGSGVHTGRASVVLVRTRITHNRGAGVVYEVEGPLVRKGLPPGRGKGANIAEQWFNMDGCVVAGNLGHGVITTEGSGSFHARASTISDNAGSGIDCFLSYINFSNCIVSHNNGPSVSYYGPPSSQALACCDVFGNKGGDWVACIADQQGINANFSLDPIFCDPNNGNFYLGVSSPCADHLGCGQVGALGVGCGPTAVEFTTWGRIKSMFR